MRSASERAYLPIRYKLPTNVRQIKAIVLGFQVFFNGNILELYLTEASVSN